MKLVFLLSMILLAAMVHETEAGFFRSLGRRIKTTVGKVSSGVKDAARSVASRVKGAVGSVRRTVKEGVDNVRDSARDSVRQLRDRLRGTLGRILRGKRSVLTLNRLDDVNAIDIAKTLNLDFPDVQDAFVRCDVDKSGSLDGQEVLTFLNEIENLDVSKIPHQSNKF
ncbi:uncharacterized protein LOC143301475 [Babylonia areolata]|uniref:uncharacterized protein LOC143301475 n=1 Tax=Babylonia areolata TaxID=304850 RepID=UPI003FD69156